MITKALVAATVSVLLIGSSCQETPAPESEVLEPPLGNAEILFRVRIADTGLQSHWLAEGNELTDLVEVRLPGKLYDPPLRFDVIQASDADRAASVGAAVSDFSAFKADEDDWILTNFLPEEQDAVRSLLNNPVARERNKNALTAEIPSTLPEKLNIESTLWCSREMPGSCRFVPLYSREVLTVRIGCGPTSSLPIQSTISCLPL